MSRHLPRGPQTDVEVDGNETKGTLDSDLDHTVLGNCLYRNLPGEDYR